MVEKKRHRSYRPKPEQDGTSVYYKGITKEDWQLINQRKAALIDAMKLNSKYLGTSKELDFFRVQPYSSDGNNSSKELWNSRAEYMYARHGRIVNEIDEVSTYVVVDNPPTKKTYDGRMGSVRGRFPGEWPNLDWDQKRMLYQKYFPSQTSHDTVSNFKVIDDIVTVDE